MKFDYGDEVVCQDGKLAVVVGITEVNSASQGGSLGVAIGTVLYTIELGDGSDFRRVEGELTLHNKS